MAVERYKHEYFIQSGSDDGFVIHDTSAIDTTSSALLLGWDFYYDEGDCDLFVAFTDIDIPQGSTIVAAYLRVNYYRIDNGYVETNLHAVTDYTIPTTYSGFTSLVGTDNFITIHQDPNPVEQIAEYEVTEIVQELIDQGDWEELNTICFFSDNTAKETSDSGADMDCYEYDSTASRLTILFEPPEEITLNDILEGGRLESFEYEQLKLVSGVYQHYDYLENVVSPGGTININFERNVIGTINLNIHDDANIDYISDLIRPWYVVTYEDVEYKFPLGTFLLNAPKRQSDGAYVERPIYGYDMLYALEQDKIDSSITYEAGETVTDLIEDILDNVGTWVKYNIPTSSETLVEDASYELGKSKLFIINSLLHKINYYPLWSSGMGVYRSIPWADVNNILWTFENNDKSLNAPGILQNIDYSNVYNKVIIIARQLTEDTEPLYKALTFEDIDMDDYPLSYTQIGRYITKIFNSEATSQSYVDSRAERELRKMTEIEEALTYKHALVFGRFGDGLPYQGDCFRFINSLLEIDNEYKIENMKIFLNTGKLVNTTIRRVISE